MNRCASAIMLATAAFGLTSVVNATDARAAQRTVSCRIELGGKVEYVGPCQFEPIPGWGGSFYLSLQGREILENISEVEVAIGDPGEATVKLRRSVGAGYDTVGEVRRSTADKSCWLGIPGTDSEGTKICAK